MRKRLEIELELFKKLNDYIDDSSYTKKIRLEHLLKVFTGVYKQVTIDIRYDDLNPYKCEGRFIRNLDGDRELVATFTFIYKEMEDVVDVARKTFIAAIRQLKLEEDEPEEKACRNCKHFMLAGWEEPCRDCSLSTHSNWEPLKEEKKEEPNKV